MPLDDRPYANDPGMIDTPRPPMSDFGIAICRNILDHLNEDGYRPSSDNRSITIFSVLDFLRTVEILGRGSVVEMHITTDEVYIRPKSADGDVITLRVGGENADVLITSELFERDDDVLLYDTGAPFTHEEKAVLLRMLVERERKASPRADSIYPEDQVA